VPRLQASSLLVSRRHVVEVRSLYSRDAMIEIEAIAVATPRPRGDARRPALLIQSKS